MILKHFESFNYHEKHKDNKIKDSALGKTLKHKSADYQVDGTAQYTDDIPKIYGELYAG